MTIKELKDYCRKNKLKGYSKLKKAELEKLVNRHKIKEKFLDVDIKKTEKNPKIPMTIIQRRQLGAFSIITIDRKQVQNEARKRKLKIWGKKWYGWGIWSDSNGNLWIYEEGEFLKFSHKISHKISKEVNIPLSEH